MERRYRITVRGVMSERFSSGFAGMTPHRTEDETVLVGGLSGLHELATLLARLDNLGLEVVAVEDARDARHDRGSG